LSYNSSNRTMQDVSDVGPVPSVADLRTLPGRSAAAFSVPPDQIILPDGVLNHRWTYHAPPNQRPFYFNKLNGQSQFEAPHRVKSQKLPSEARLQESNRSHSYSLNDAPPPPPQLASGTEMMNYQLRLAELETKRAETDAILRPGYRHPRPS